MLWLTHNVGQMPITAGCLPVQDAIQQRGRKLFRTEINHSIKRGKQSFPTDGSTESSGKSWRAHFPPLNGITSCVRSQMKHWVCDVYLGLPMGFAAVVFSGLSRVCFGPKCGLACKEYTLICQTKTKTFLCNSWKICRGQRIYEKTYFWSFFY